MEFYLVNNQAITTKSSCRSLITKAMFQSNSTKLTCHHQVFNFSMFVKGILGGGGGIQWGGSFCKYKIKEHCIGLKKNKKQKHGLELLQRAQVSPGMSAQAESR